YVQQLERPAPMDLSGAQKGGLEEQFIKLVTNHIKPQAWACLGGEATIDFYSLGKALVVTANPETQEEIAKFLKELLSLTEPGMDEEEDAPFPCLPAPFGFLRMAAPLPPCCLPGPMQFPAMA